jgi:hypothetical protein
VSWIKLHRKITLNPMWTAEPFTRGQAWVDMLMSAAYTQTHVRIRGVRVDLKPGQIALSEVAYAAKWQWSRGKVRRFLSELETVQQIVQQKTNVTTVVTVTNYSTYQHGSTADGTASDTADGQQTVQQTDTLEEGKKGEEGKEQGSAGASVVISEATDIPDTYKGFVNPDTVAKFHNEATGSNPSPEFLAMWRAAVAELVALETNPDRLSAALAWYISPGATFRPKWPETRFLRADWFQALIAKHTAELGK